MPIACPLGSKLTEWYSGINGANEFRQMYSVQLGFRGPKDVPQGSTQDGVPSRRSTSSSDVPSRTTLYRDVIRELRQNAHPSTKAISTATARTTNNTLWLILESHILSGWRVVGEKSPLHSVMVGAVWPFWFSEHDLTDKVRFPHELHLRHCILLVPGWMG